MQGTLNTTVIGAFASSALILLSASLSAQTVGGGFDTLEQWQGTTTVEHLGHAVATAGDVNGDGYADVIVGMFGSPGSANTAGSAFVYSGLDGSVIYQFNGAAANDHFGSSVSGAGDINGDGFADFIIGAPDAFPGGLADSGAAYIYSGVNGALLYQLSGQNMGDRFGYSVSGAGDVNGDGFTDVIVGAIGAGSGVNTSAGAAFVYSGATGAQLFQWNGTSGGMAFGDSVSGGGDLNGDGFSDVIVGAWGANPGGLGMAGSAFAYSGADGSLLHRWNGANEGDFFGRSVSDAGDVNADGYTDVIIGTHGTNPNGLVNAGSAYVYSGVTGSLLYQWDGTAFWQAFGLSVAAAGDINNDGHSDLIVGAPSMDSPTQAFAGSAVIYSGADGSVLEQMFGEASGSFFGASVSSAADINRDGNIDVIVGATGTTIGSLFEVGSASVFGFSPFLNANTATLSASTGGALNLDMDFPATAAAHDFKVLISAAGTGPSSYGVEIPLTRDALVVASFQGNYPFATHSNLHGTLNANGDAFADIIAPAGLQAGLIGRTFWMAAIASPVGQLPTHSSVAVAVTITP